MSARVRTPIARLAAPEPYAAPQTVANPISQPCTTHVAKFVPPPTGYLDLLRRNRDFRLLWLGQLVSQLGDWFNAVAVYALLLDLTGSATAVAWMLIVQLLPMTLAGPLAGVIADRFNRQRIMIGADFARAILILGLLLIQTREQVWIAYAVMTAVVACTALFEPARTATIPNITGPDDLLAANALSSATWSAMLAIGAAVGGAITAIVGRNAAFVLNTLSFAASALLIARVVFPAAPARAKDPYACRASVTGAAAFVDGLRYLRQERQVAALLFVKAGWGIAGGVLLLLTIFGQRVFPVYGSTAAGIGVLYGARGLGAGLGPILARYLFGEEPRRIRRLIAPSYFVVAVFYLALARMPSLLLASLAVVGAHIGGSVLWVFSTVLLQLEVPDTFRGRVFAAELGLVTLTSSASSYLTGYGLDVMDLAPQTLSTVLGLCFVAPGTLWMLIERHWRDRPARLTVPPVEDEELERRVGA